MSYGRRTRPLLWAMAALQPGDGHTRRIGRAVCFGVPWLRACNLEFTFVPVHWAPTLCPKLGPPNSVEDAFVDPQAQKTWIPP